MRGVVDGMDVAGLRASLADHDYVLDGHGALACSLALRLHRPLLVEGDPDTGKTSLAVSLARVLGVSLIRLACHRGLDVPGTLYSWDTSRQLLHLRAAAGLRTERGDVDPTREGLYSRRFLRAGPLLEALDTAPCVLLVDDLDRAGEQLDAVLLQFLSDAAITIPEFGTVRAASPPWVILTSTRTREVHDALKRRCHYLRLERPGQSLQTEIVRRQEPGALAAIAAQLRSGRGRRRPDDVDWTRATALLGDGDGTEAAALGRLLREAQRSG